MPSILSEENDLRANTYKVLAGFFLKEPDAETLSAVKADLEMKFNDQPADIVSDFKRLVTDQEGHPAPNESFYHYPLGDKPRFWGKAAEEVQRFYELAGVMLYEEMHLMPDHIAAELLFMSYLVEKGDVELQKRFLDEHLMTWVPQYSEEIIAFANTDFYKEIAEITSDFIISEYEELQEIIT